MDEIVRRIDEKEWDGFSSKWSILEVARALKKDKKPKEIISVDVEELKSHNISFLPLKDELLLRAENLIKEFNLYAADAPHIASFESVKNLDAFICDDRHFNRLKSFVPVKKPSGFTAVQP